MRRPAKTAKQRQYEREVRALYRLRRAAVRWSECVDHEEEMLADLQAAADAYTTTLGTKQRKAFLR